jgi:3-hydroxyisobutyrate dehydrogenase-like beta-hydroxyacid dehydrogenase
LPDSDVVAAVLDEIEPVLVPGQTLIDTTTGSPEATEAVARRLAERGVAWLDATVAGSSQQMSQGDAVLLVGGDEQAFGRQRPLLEPLARELFWLGPSGSGARMKLVVNLAIGMHRAVLAEALALARALGLDLEQALAVLKATPAYSRVMDTKGLKMVRREFSPQARLAQHLKDVRLMIQSARGRGQALPLSELHEQILQSRVDRGDGGLDNSAVVRAWFDDPGERFRG